MSEMSCKKHSLEGLLKISDEYYLCPTCKKAFTKEELKDVLSQEEWDEEFGESDMPWYQVLTEDEGYWHMEAMTDFPYFIAHEYKRLFDMLKNGEEYGSLMQMKDVFEVMLKFPLVIILTGCEKKLRDISDHYEADKTDVSLLDMIKTDYSEIYSITELILSKPLCIGDWERIANLAKKLEVEKDLPEDLSDLYQLLIPVINKIAEKFRKLHISHWRNESIGHGALALNSQEENCLEEDYKKKLLGLKEMMEECAAFYENYRLVGDNKVCLDGHDLDLKELTDVKSISVNNFLDEEAGLDLTPYLIHENNRIFIVDAYYSYKNKADMLNYSHGKKISNSKLLERFDELLKLFKIASVPPKDIYSNNLSNVDIEAFEKIISHNEIYFPEYLHNWVSSVINQEEGGVFLLEGERGTGKTQFANVLNELADTAYRNDKKKRHRIDGLMVRTWHFNSTYNSKIGNFKEGVVADLRTYVDKSKGYKRLLPNQFKKNEKLTHSCSAFISDKDAGGKEFAQLVSDILKGYQDEGKDIDKILIFLDGIDEVNTRLEEGENHSGTSIFDLLPSPEDVPENVYFIITSRLVEEVADNQYIYDQLKKIEVTDTFTLARANEGYQKLLHKYAKDQIVNKYIESNDETANNDDVSIAKRLLEKSEYRFNYLRAYEQLYRGNMDIESIDSHNLFQGFLEGIKSLGSGYYKDVLDFMVTLAIVEEEEVLTFKEMAYLLGEEMVTLKFMAIIMDMKAFLRISRSPRGNCISLSHAEWRRQILVGCGEYRAYIVKKLENKFFAFSGSLNNEITDQSNDIYLGETWLTANIVDIIQQNVDLKYKNNMAKILKYYIRPNGCLLDRYIKVNTAYMTILHRLKDQGEHIEDNEIASTYLKRGIAYDDKREFVKAIKDLDYCIIIREDLYEKSKKGVVTFDVDDLAGAYMSRGISYSNNIEGKKAIQEYNKCIKIREDLYEKSQKGLLSFDEDNLALAYHNRGISFIGRREYNNALKDYEKCIEIREKLAEKSRKGLITFCEEDLAATYSLRANVYTISGACAYGLDITEDSAKKDLETSVRIYEELYEKSKPEPSVELENGLSFVYSVRGSFYCSLGEYEKARRDYTENIAIQEKMYDRSMKGLIIFDKDNLANAYMSLAGVYYELGEIEQAFEGYKRSISIREDLHEKSEKGIITFDDNNLAFSYKSMSNLYYREGMYEEALNFAKKGYVFYINTVGTCDFEHYDFDRTLNSLFEAAMKEAPFSEVMEPVDAIFNYCIEVVNEKYRVLDKKNTSELVQRLLGRIEFMYGYYRKNYINYCNAEESEKTKALAKINGMTYKELLDKIVVEEDTDARINEDSVFTLYLQVEVDQEVSDDACLYYDGGYSGILLKNNHTVVLCNLVPPDYHKMLSQCEEVLIKEIIVNHSIISEYRYTLPEGYTLISEYKVPVERLEYIDVLADKILADIKEQDDESIKTDKAAELRGMTYEELFDKIVITEYAWVDDEDEANLELVIQVEVDQEVSNDACIYYNCGYFAFLIKNDRAVILCDLIPKDAHKILNRCDEVIIVEVDKENYILAQYKVPVEKIGGVDRLADKILEEKRNE